jgi:hypothetical protein
VGGNLKQNEKQNGQDIRLPGSGSNWVLSRQVTVTESFELWQAFGRFNLHLSL